MATKVEEQRGLTTRTCGRRSDGVQRLGVARSATRRAAARHPEDGGPARWGRSTATAQRPVQGGPVRPAPDALAGGGGRRGFGRKTGVWEREKTERG